MTAPAITADEYIRTDFFSSSPTQTLSDKPHSEKNAQRLVVYTWSNEVRLNVSMTTLRAVYKYYPVIAPATHLLTLASLAVFFLYIWTDIRLIYPYISGMVFIASAGLSLVTVLATKTILHDDKA